MSIIDLEKLVGEKAESIMEVANDVGDYLEFKALIDLGLQVHHSEIGFDKIMVFSWIKEGLGSGRKH